MARMLPDTHFLGPPAQEAGITSECLLIEIKEIKNQNRGVNEVPSKIVPLVNNLPK